MGEGFDLNDPIALPMAFCGATASFGDGTAQVKLPTSLISFRVDGDLPGITRADFEAACFEAWRRWARVIGITVDKHANTKTDPTQIVVTTRLDRAGGVLADQQLPYGNGMGLLMRIDTSENWGIDDTPAQGVMNLLAVLCHEDGHCLGMQHIDAEGDADLMNPIYSPKIYLPQEDDISYGRKLYGPAKAQPTPPTSPGTAMVDNLRVTIDGVTYEAKGPMRRVA